MNIKDQKTQQTIFIFFILIIILVLFFFFPYKANAKKIHVLSGISDSLKIKVQEAEQARARLPELQARIARLEAEWLVAKEMLPEQKEIPSLIQQISNSGTKAAVSFILFRPSGPTPKANYDEIPVQIKVACGYHNLGKFLANIGNLSRIVNVPQIRLVAGKEKSVEAELSAVTYTVSKQKEATRGAPPRR